MTTIAELIDQLQRLASISAEKPFNYSVLLPGGESRAYNFLNYMGSARDVMTMAHEVGHGAHGMLAADAQGALMFRAPMAYAETASIFGEMTTFQYVLQQTSSDEQKLALNVLQLRPSTAGLAVAIKAQEMPGLKKDATDTTLQIASKLGGQGVELQKVLSSAGLKTVDLEIVKATYGAGDQQRDVTKDLKKFAGSLPLITLPSPSYNASFGGDPAPGIVKQLNIEFTIDGEPGKVTLKENDLILLPTAK